MNLNSAKNILQELYQKQQKPTPTYVTKNYPPKNKYSKHQQYFRSTVSLEDGRTFTSELQTSKKKAEMNAAEKAIKTLEKVDQKRIMSSVLGTKIQIDYPTWVLIDLENVNDWKNLANLDFERPIKFIGFVGKLNSLYEKKINEERIEIIKIPLAYKDAADTAMIFLAGWLAHKLLYYTNNNNTNNKRNNKRNDNKNDNINIYVVTRDHFGATLHDILNNQILLEEIEDITGDEMENKENKKNNKGIDLSIKDFQSLAGLNSYLVENYLAPVQ